MPEQAKRRCELRKSNKATIGCHAKAVAVAVAIAVAIAIFSLILTCE